MKKLLPFAAVACALVLCFALMGCGGSGNKIDEKAFVGTYSLTEIEEDGEITSEDDIALLKAFGMEFGLELNEDHSASMIFFGENVDGTWEATAANAGKLELAELGSTAFTLDNGKLVMEADGDKMTFTKNS